MMSSSSASTTAEPPSWVSEWQTFGVSNVHDAATPTSTMHPAHQPQQCEAAHPHDADGDTLMDLLLSFSHNPSALSHVAQCLAELQHRFHQEVEVHDERLRELRHRHERQRNAMTDCRPTSSPYALPSSAMDQLLEIHRGEMEALMAKMHAAECVLQQQLRHHLRQYLQRLRTTTLPLADAALTQRCAEAASIADVAHFANARVPRRPVARRTPSSKRASSSSSPTHTTVVPVRGLLLSNPRFLTLHRTTQDGRRMHETFSVELSPLSDLPRCLRSSSSGVLPPPTSLTNNNNNATPTNVDADEALSHLLRLSRGRYTMLLLVGSMLDATEMMHSVRMAELLHPLQTSSPTFLPLAHHPNLFMYTTSSFWGADYVMLLDSSLSSTSEEEDSAIGDVLQRAVQWEVDVLTIAILGADISPPEHPTSATTEEEHTNTSSALSSSSSSSLWRTMSCLRQLQKGLASTELCATGDATLSSLMNLLNPHFLPHGLVHGDGAAPTLAPASPFPTQPTTTTTAATATTTPRGALSPRASCASPQLTAARGGHRGAFSCNIRVFLPFDGGFRRPTTAAAPSSATNNNMSSTPATNTTTTTPAPSMSRASSLMRSVMDVVHPRPTPRAQHTNTPRTTIPTTTTTTTQVARTPRRASSTTPSEEVVMTTTAQLTATPEGGVFDSFCSANSATPRRADVEVQLHTMEELMHYAFGEAAELCA